MIYPNIANAEVVLFVNNTIIIVIEKNLSTLQDKVARAMMHLNIGLKKTVIYTDKTKAMLLYLNK
jgi:hypothetical protein